MIKFSKLHLCFMVMFVLLLSLACGKTNTEDDLKNDEINDELNNENVNKNEFYVTFTIGGEKTTQKVKKGEKVSVPDDIDKEGYEFLGWFDGDSKYDFSSPVTSDISLKAKLHKINSVDNINFSNYIKEDYEFSNNKYRFTIEGNNIYLDKYRSPIITYINMKSVYGIKFGVHTKIIDKESGKNKNANAIVDSYNIISDNIVDILYKYDGGIEEEDLKFPLKFDRKDFEELYVGNMIISQIPFNKTDSVVTVQKSDGSTFNASALIYDDTGHTWSEECAEYLEEKGVTVTAVDNNGKIAENESEISKWELKNLKDESGKLKVNFNDGINSEGSPCEMNPFTNTSSLWNALQLVDSESEEKVYNNSFINHGSDASPYYVFKNKTVLYKQMINRFLYSVPDSFHSEDVESYLYPTVGSYINTPVYFDYNSDGIYTEDEKFIYGGYQAREVLDDGTKVWLYDGETGRPVQDTLSEEMIEKQNDKFGYFVISGNVYVNVRFTFLEDRIEVSVNDNEILDGASYGHNHLVDKILFFPYFEEFNIKEKVYEYDEENKTYTIMIDDIYLKE